MNVVKAQMGFHEEWTIRYISILRAPTNGSIVQYNEYREKHNIIVRVNIRWKDWQRENWKICCDIQEANHALQSVIINSNGDGHEQNTSLPWLLMEQ